jgi:alpha-galactosidase
VRIPDLADALVAITIRKLTTTQLTVEAALTGDRGLFAEALLTDGADSDPDVAAKLADEFLQAHRQNLHNFFPAG